jgi:hypothetical protein
MNGSTTYDFSLSQGQAYGNNQIQLFDATGYAIYSGDISDANLVSVSRIELLNRRTTVIWRVLYI